MAVHCPCPACAAPLRRVRNNTPALDLQCSGCGEGFELKASRKGFRPRFVNGAYATLMARLVDGRAPNLMQIAYESDEASVSKLTPLSLRALPRRFFTPALVVPKTALSPRARRPGWIGSFIDLRPVEPGAFVQLADRTVPRDPNSVTRDWARRAALPLPAELEAGAWLPTIRAVVDRIGKDRFALADLYAFEDRLAALFPGNRTIRAKIRQQLQVLRNDGELVFDGHGHYRRAQEGTRMG